MLVKTKNKIITQLLIGACTIIVSLSLLFYSTSGKGSITSKNKGKSSSEFSANKVEGSSETKETPHFSIFSILNKLIPN